jgi:hypothetical protein
MSESSLLLPLSLPRNDIRVRRTRAYETLKISRDELRASPPITPQLRMIAKSLRKRNLPISPYYYLKCASPEYARWIVDLYYSLPRDQRDLIPIEGYCLSLHLPPNDILETIVRTIAIVSRQRSIAIASSAHPSIVEKTVEMALTDEGIEDRTLIHKAVGFLPTPKGSQITVNASANSASAASPTIVLPAPPPEATIRRLVDRFNDQRALPAAPPADIPARMPYEDAISVPVTIDDSDEDEE